MGIFIGFKHFLVWAITINFLCLAQFYNKRPWPTYSLQNMPNTDFSCRDKILGGYYADAETQCQMFHVCVKVAGVGVQDFRFLCPNGTAFDQEAQICADWGDVDCEAATLYYGSDNFDLYRIGSGFDRKRAPYAEEEDEATYHLQRAETGDARRSKQIVVDQSTKPEKDNLNPFQKISKSITRQHYSTPKITTTTTTTTPVSIQQTQQINSNYNYNNYNQNNYQYPTTTQKQQLISSTNTAAISETYKTTKQAVETNYNDEIFKGSQSQHFYSNKNNGKDDFDDEQNVLKKTTTTKRPTTIRSRGRARGHIRANYNNLGSFYDKTTVPSTIATKPTTITIDNSQRFLSRSRLNNYNQYQSTQNNYNNNYNQFNSGQKSSTSTTTTVTTQDPDYKFNAYNTALKLQQQQQLAVEEYKKNPPSTTINPEEIFKKQAVNYFNNDGQDVYKVQNKYFRQPTTSGTTSTTTTQAPTITTTTTKNQFYNNNYEQQYQNYNRNPVEYQQNNQTQTTYTLYVTSTPTPFTTYNPTNQKNFQSTVPRGFSKSIDYQDATVKYQSVNRRNENYTPASTLKKFSTHVPKDQYNPTTFKPNTYKKPIENYSFPKKEKILAPRFDPSSLVQTSIGNTPSSTTTSTTTTSTTGNPYAEIDEDDGQYHPELYEKDFAKYKIKQKFTTNHQQQSQSNNYNNPIQQKFDIPQSKQLNYELQSSEDEFLKTAHSQNIAASGNLLKNSEKLNKPKQRTTIIVSKAPTIPPNIKTTKKPVNKNNNKDDKDASYDYAYYDSSNSHDYTQYDLIEEFGRTSKKQRN